MAALPYEILKLILDRVECSSTLTRLCLTSSWIRQMAEPLLYKTFNHSDTRGTKQDDKYRRWQLRRFVRTLILRPDLAFRVETVNIGYWEQEWFNDDDGTGLTDTAPQTYEEDVETSEGGFGIFLEALEAAGLFQEQPLADLLNRGLEEPLIALIFALCPNVQTFSAKAAPFMDYLPDAFQDMKTGPVSAYRPGNGSKIRTVSMGANSIGTNSMGTNPPSDTMSASFLDHYWKLPNIETIHSTNIDEMSLGGDIWEEGVSVVKNLNFEFACISNAKLVEILTLPIALRTLKLSWGYSAYDGVQFSGPALGEGLSYQKHSLRELEVFDWYGLMTNGELRRHQDSPLGGTGLLPRFQGKSQAHILELTPVIDFMGDDTAEVILVNGEEKHMSDDLRYFSSGDGDTDPARFKIGSLVGFSCLERVSLPSVYFLGQDHDESHDIPTALLTLGDVVPDSLIHLNIQNPHHAWVFLEVKVLLEGKEWRTPKLRKVELTVSVSPRRLWEPLAKARLSSESRETLQRLAVENQVELFIDPLL